MKLRSEGGGFRDRIQASARQNSSRIVLALDITGSDPAELLRLSLKRLKSVSRSVAAVKLNYHLLLPLDLFGGAKRIVDEAHAARLPVIADLKLNDIGSTNLVASSYLWQAGFDALIANPFVGYEEGLGPVIREAHRLEKGVLLLVYMSHQGSSEGFGLKVAGEAGGGQRVYELFLERALSWGADGVIVGATQPELIAQVRKTAGRRLLVFSPGVGVQGGSPVDAVRAGSDFLIVGRTIVNSPDPHAAAEEMRRATWIPLQTS